MNLLPELQRRFVDFALFAKEQDQAASGIKSMKLNAAQCLSIYRNNTRLGLTEALRDTYPVLNKLVGNAFFDYLADRYIRSYPPKDPCLLLFGGQLANFLTDFPETEGLPYLPDIARLEWFYQQAYYEADAKPLEIAILADMAPDLYGEIGFNLHPSCRLLASNYPVLKIWQANQGQDAGEGFIDYRQGGCCLLIFRPEWDVYVMPLTQNEHFFLSLLAKHLTLAQALEELIQQGITLDILPIISHWFAKGLFTGIFINIERNK